MITEKCAVIRVLKQLKALTTRTMVIIIFKNYIDEQQHQQVTYKLVSYLHILR